MIETNYYTNICPQVPSFNRGIWKRLENQVRRWVEVYDTLYIVSGPILSKENKTIGNNIIVPSMFYKVILLWDGWEYKSIAFLIPNKKYDENIFAFQVSIDYIELITGINFFYLLPDNIENKLEKENTLVYE
jgi:endonuclease G